MPHLLSETACEEIRQQTPLVHLNGSGRESLCDMREAVYSKLQEAEDALRQMAPNGRDYYIAEDGPQRLERATASHFRRLETLARLMEEMELECEAIQGR